MAMISVSRLPALFYLVAIAIGLYLPASVRSLPDCGISSSPSPSSHSLSLLNSRRLPRGDRSSHSFSSPPTRNSPTGNPQVVAVLSKLQQRRPRFANNNEQLRINNLLGRHFHATTTSNSTSSSSSSSENYDETAEVIRERGAEAADDSADGDGRQQQRRRGRRKGRIINGRETDEGEFPWQASLQLLHPVLGFIGHWCGGVLIDQNWILSAAHCVHNDLFNLVVPEAWSVVLGDYDRHKESGYEQRIAIDRIVMHDNYENYQHDVVLMRLSRPANIQRATVAKKICLPFVSTSGGLGVSAETLDDIDTFDGNSNQLRKLKQRQQQQQQRRNGQQSRRRNDKFVKERILFRDNSNSNIDSDSGWSDRKKYVTNFNQQWHFPITEDKRTQPFSAKSKVNDLPYRDCVATGWGMMTANGELTDILLQSKVPLLSNHQCQRAYRGYVKIHSGHLCGGKADGEGGTCVGDSGGPLQCRITKNGPWILAGITSFGWNCSENVPDVFTRISYYVNWITDTINER